MSSGGENSEIDIKLVMKAIQDEFAHINQRLDNIESPSNLKLSKRNMGEELEEEDSDYVVSSVRKHEGVVRR